MSKARAKGSGWEVALLGPLRRIWPSVDRAPLKGINDYGDFLNADGLLLEAKKTDVPHFLKWAKIAAAKTGGSGWRIIWSGDQRRKDGPFVLMPLQDWLDLEIIAKDKALAA